MQRQISSYIPLGIIWYQTFFMHWKTSHLLREVNTFLHRKSSTFANTKCMNGLINKGPQAKLINGKEIATTIQNELRDDINNWFNKFKRRPTLVTVLVGDDPASVKYVQKKMEAATYVGISGKILELPNTITEPELIEKVEELNTNPEIDGILVQLPLPHHISERNVCNAVDVSKDVDGFHLVNMGKLSLNMETFVPCTVLAVVELLQRTAIETFGKNVVICGRSKHIGLPLAMLLHSDARNNLPGMEATVTLCHRHTPPEQLEIFTKSADIIVSATGVINLIKPHMVKPGVCIIDVGMNRVEVGDGKVKLVGDVDFTGLRNVASYITPVPGGVGPVTVAMLMKNTFKAASGRQKV